MNIFTILWILLMVLCEIASASRTKLVLSKIENEVKSLKSDVHLLQFDSAEVKLRINTLNETCYRGNKLSDPTSKQRNAYKTAPDTDDVTRLFKAFTHEKMFCRENMNVLLKSQNAITAKVEALEAENGELHANLEKDRESSKDFILKTRQKFARRDNRFRDFDNKLEKLKSDTVPLSRDMKLIKDTLQEYSVKMKQNEKLSEKCDSSWRYNSNLESCFLFISTKKDWNDAVSFCSARGARLVEIKNKNKNAQLKRMFEDTGFDWGDYLYGGFWAGGSRKGNTLDSFVWEESKSPFSWKNWYGKEPNRLTQSCLNVMQKDEQFRWHDYECYIKRPFVCEKFIT